MGFLPRCGCVSTTIWIYHLDANETHQKKARLGLYKNATGCFEQISSVQITDPVYVCAQTIMIEI